MVPFLKKSKKLNIMTGMVQTTTESKFKFVTKRSGLAS